MWHLHSIHNYSNIRITYIIYTVSYWVILFRSCHLYHLSIFHILCVEHNKQKNLFLYPVLLFLQRIYYLVWLSALILSRRSNSQKTYVRTISFLFKQKESSFLLYNETVTKLNICFFSRKRQRKKLDFLYHYKKKLMYADMCIIHNESIILNICITTEFL